MCEYVCVCVFSCVCVCVRARVRACVRACLQVNVVSGPLEELGQFGQYGGRDRIRFASKHFIVIDR